MEYIKEKFTVNESEGFYGCRQTYDDYIYRKAIAVSGWVPKKEIRKVIDYELVVSAQPSSRNNMLYTIMLYMLHNRYTAAKKDKCIYRDMLLLGGHVPDFHEWKKYIFLESIKAWGL